MRRHVVITGTGRTGTTFLVQLLTELGLDTGFTRDNMHSWMYENARAGLEYDIRKDESPYIVKSPLFCEHVEEVLSRDDIEINCVFVPMRNLHGAAESRRYVVSTSLSSSPHVPGGLWGTEDADEQEVALLHQVYNLFLALSNTSIPIILLQYPRITQDPRYLYEKLAPILADVDYDTFCTGHKKSVNPNWVHSFHMKDC